MRRLVANEMQEWLDSELQCEACGLNLLGARRSLRAKLAGYSGRQLGNGARGGAHVAAVKNESVIFSSLPPE